MPFNLLDHTIYLSAPQRKTPSAWIQHVPFAMLLVELTRPQTLVELGSYSGMSYCAFCQAVDELKLDTRCFAVDSWEGDDHQGAYGPAVLAELRAHHDPRYAAFSTLVQSRFDDAAGAFADGSIDLLHIDGYHTYAAVKHDVETWLPKMSARGVMLFHDIAERRDDFGVWRLWDELKRRYPQHLEFEHGHGLGVVAVGAEVPAELAALMALPPAQWHALRDLLRTRGEGIEASQRLQMIGEELTRAEHARDALETALAQANTTIAQAHDAIAAERKLLHATRASSARDLNETRRQLNNALWQLEWLNHSRGVRMVKLARASRALLTQRGPLWLSKRAALWLMGKRGYYRLDSAVALPVPKQPRPVAREYKQVMFLSGCPGGSMRYRCDHQAEQLNLLGCSAESAAVSVTHLPDLLDRFQTFVLHRVPYDADLQAFIAEARKRGKTLIFESDDLVFIPENASLHAELERLTPQERAHAIEEMGRMRQTLRLSDAATVSTAPLRDWMAPLCAQVAVTPNVVSGEIIALSAAARAGVEVADPESAPGAVTITYLSGSPSHDRDFLEAQESVLWALETYPQTRLLVVGPLSLSAAFERFGARVRREPFRPWQELPAIYAQSAINLAPLERDNPFTAAKSAVRFLEAALLDVPTIASPLPDFTRVIRHGENGLLADTPDAWREALRQLIESPDERRRLGAQSHADVLRDYTTTAQAPSYSDVMRDLYRAVTPARESRSLRINWMVDAPANDETAQPAAALWLARALAARGHRVSVCISAPPAADDARDDTALLAWARQDFAEEAGAIIIGDDIPLADASVATSATTARVVAQSHTTLFRFALSQPQSGETLPLRYLDTPAVRAALTCADSQTPEAGIRAAATDQLERALLDYCW